MQPLLYLGGGGETPPAPASSPAWIATCPEDTKSVLLTELAALGVTDLTPIYRGATFRADLATAYRAHLVLRTASRIQRVVAVLPAGSAEVLATAAAGVVWPVWLRAQRAFRVSPILTDNAARAVGEAAVITSVRDAVLAGFTGAAPGQPPRFDPDADNPVTLVAHLRAGVCTLGLDTAGRALHKRGWRLNGHPAVLKETLAAAVLLLAGYDGTEVLYDPMCGSGTLVIEGAYLALGKAPLIHRGKDDFGFEHHAGFDRALWRQVCDRVRADRRAAPPAPLYASDLRAEFVQLAREGALRARVEKHITYAVGAFEASTPPADRGLLVMNLPYGERIGQGTIDALYRGVGRTLRERYAAWRIALLVPADAPRGALGLRRVREVPLVNGALPVRLLIVEP